MNRTKKSFFEFIGEFSKEDPEERFGDAVIIKDKVFLIKDEIREILETTDLDVFSAGLFLGIDKKGRFKPSFDLLELLEKRSDKKSVISPLGEKMFLYGKDVFSSEVLEQSSNLGKTIVKNKRGEVLGIGKLDKGNVRIKNFLDRGDFLRRER